jgi:hypothetical protein
MFRPGFSQKRGGFALECSDRVTWDGGFGRKKGGFGQRHFHSTLLEIKPYDHTRFQIGQRPLNEEHGPPSPPQKHKKKPHSQDPVNLYQQVGSLHFMSGFRPEK